MGAIYCLLSVDWELDHGPWRAPGSTLDYGGALRGTPAFAELLDDLEIPCTWFVEASDQEARDLPRRLPEAVRGLLARGRDEVGLHIHWERAVPGQGVIYETGDRAWLGERLAEGAAGIAALGRKVESFRGGAFLRVAGLPCLLSQTGIRNDSTVLWRGCRPVRSDRRAARPTSKLARLASLWRRLAGPLPGPYATAEESVERGGMGPIVEFPVFFNPLDIGNSLSRRINEYIVKRSVRSIRPVFLTLFFHIDELTVPGSGADEKARVDEKTREAFHRTLSALKGTPGLRFVTMREARRTMEEGMRA